MTEGTIALAADHAGFELKEAIKADLVGAGRDVLDLGTMSADRVDYPDFAERLADAVKAGRAGGVPPRGVRAMAALHARHGLSSWPSLVIPAENLARFGHPISRAFARDIARAAEIIRADPELSRIFRASSGGLPVEGNKASPPSFQIGKPLGRQLGDSYIPSPIPRSERATHVWTGTELSRNRTHHCRRSGRNSTLAYSRISLCRPMSSCHPSWASDRS